MGQIFQCLEIPDKVGIRYTNPGGEGSAVLVYGFSFGCALRPFRQMLTAGGVRV
jgi:hypothetical protein